MSELIRRPIKIAQISVVTGAHTVDTGQVIGQPFEIAHASLDGGAGVIIQSLTALSPGPIFNTTMILFDKKPTDTYIEGAAFDPSTADAAKICAVLSLNTTPKEFGSSNSAVTYRAVGVDFGFDSLCAPKIDIGNGSIDTSLWGIVLSGVDSIILASRTLVYKLGLEQL